MKRIWHIRMTVELNDPEITRHEDPYYDDQEVPFQLREWFDDALSDRDDSPHITWSEFTRHEEKPRPAVDLDPLADTGNLNIIRGTG